MRNLRCYYSESVENFLQQSSKEIIGIIHSNDISAETSIQQSNTWEFEVEILKKQLADFTEGRIIFEYTILAIETSGYIISDLLCASGNVYRVLSTHIELLIKFVIPVGASIIEVFSRSRVHVHL